uniref:Uncharacterized protein n=1 Tax=Anguilla anguilla TaxID=7936 RepID=A0A0E9QZU6_ANGAN
MSWCEAKRIWECLRGRTSFFFFCLFDCLFCFFVFVCFLFVCSFGHHFLRAC